MPRPSSDFTRCPDCGHRTVLFHFGRGGEDYYRCIGYTVRYSVRCPFSCFAEPASWDTAGKADLARWQALNPKRDGP